MGPAIHEDLGLGEAHQGEIADQVQQLMAHRFIWETQRRIQPVVSITNQGIVEGTTLNQPRCPQLLHLVAEAEGAGRGDLIDEGLRRQGD